MKKDFTKSEVRQEKLFGAGVRLWCAFAGGASLMMLFINFGMLRPTQRQLEQLECRVGSLQGSIQQIVGQTGGVEKTNSLLGLLHDQQDELAVAAVVLGDLVELKEGLIAGEEKVVKAQHCLNEVSGLARGLIDQQQLPGVGHKTASVIMAQCFGVPAFPVDTHIHRLMYRWGFSNGKNVVQTERDAKRLFPEEIWNDLHLQIIWYGRQYSPARGWNLDQDIITKTIGRKSILKEYLKSKKPR